MKVIRVRQRKTKTTRKKYINIQKSSTLMSQYTPTEAPFPPANSFILAVLSSLTLCTYYLVENQVSKFSELNNQNILKCNSSTCNLQNA